MVALVSAVLAGTYSLKSYAWQVLALKQTLCAEMLSWQGVTAGRTHSWESVLSRQRKLWAELPHGRTAPVYDIMALKRLSF